MAGGLSCQPKLVVAVVEIVMEVLIWSAMSVVKLVTLHVSVAYGLVLEALVVEGAAAEVLDTAVVVEVAAAAQDIGGAQAIAEGNIKWWF
jgi:uncharacterized membrane protein (DUF373 family)